jgi:hypothetical protein
MIIIKYKMPEGPEVKIVTEWLHKTANNYVIIDCPDEYPLNSKSDYKKSIGYRRLIGNTITSVT